MSTLDQTIVGPPPSEGFAFLDAGPGRPYVVRNELAEPRPGRDRRRRSLVYLAQLSDFQISDEESPARVEFLDNEPSGFAKSAWRPQESLVALQVEYTIRQVNRFLHSPVPQGDGRRAQMLNAVLTGDQADNQQRNETESVVRLLEGGTVDPGSGTGDLAHPLCPPDGAAIRDFDDPDRYTGVQDHADYAAPGDIFYDPADLTGIYQRRGWPTYPGLLDRAQRPFRAEGLQVPSYVAFGNHDALVQGNAAANAATNQIATGCVKPLVGLGDEKGPLSFSGSSAELLARAQSEPQNFALVPRDPDRRFVSRPEYKDLFATTSQPDAHGFAHVDEEELRASDGAASYYDFSPREGIRYIVVDSVSEGGVPGDSSNGNIDDPQFRWLERELAEAQRRGELTLVFIHHAIESLSSSVPDEAAPQCPAGIEVSAGCDRDPRLSVPLHQGPDLEQLLLGFPNVIGLVAGHSHESRVRPRPGGEGQGFWEIKSPAVVDWPTQHRLIEVMDNRDGTLSIFGTMLDHAGPITAPGSSDASGFSEDQLVALGRTLAYNDPQVGPGADGEAGEPGAQPGDAEVGPEGTANDRNVELLIRDPRARSAQTPPERGSSPGTGEAIEDQGEEGGAPADDDSPEGPSGLAATAQQGGGSLPFTGQDALIVALAGGLVVGTGVLLRRLRLT
ncbi:MAG TPA: hypothetical protein VGW11_11360 [Solirubrobacteraceae bacterium]|nr:hypothetical protein [Solirubrobacteraceae bacterium]